MDAQTPRPSYVADADHAPAGNPWPGRLLRAVVPLGILGLGIAGMMVLNATRKPPEKKEDGPAAIAVEMATAVREEATSRIESKGEVRPRTSTELSARASGQVVWVSTRLESGAQVTSGEKLLQIDTANYKLALESSEADAARAREALTRARAEADLAARDYRELGLNEAPSDLALGRPQVATAEANLRAAEARIDEARLALARTTITAPYSGRVLRRSVDVGDFVGMGVPVASLFATDSAQIRVPLTDTELGALGLYPGFSPTKAKPAPIAEITADVAGQTAKWTGELVSVDATIDAASRQTFALVEVKKPFDPGASVPLAPGVFATVSLAAQTKRSLVKVPRGALKRGAEIYVVRADSTIEIRPVSPAQTDVDSVWIASGVEAGEKVVVSYVPSARTGLPVSDLKAPPPPKPAKAEDEKGKKKAKDKDAKKDETKKAEQ